MDNAIREQLNEYQIQFPLLQDWFDYLKMNTTDSSRINHILLENPTYFEELILELSEAFRLLPERPIRFQDYSQIITQDPQGLNTYNDLGYFFFHAIAENARMAPEERVRFPETDSEKERLLAKLRLIYDDINDQVIVANLLAESTEGYDNVWETAVYHEHSFTVSIRELLPIEFIYPANEKPYVWVIESPRIFSSLLDEVPHAPMICTQGRRVISFAVQHVLDKLIESRVQLRYAGNLCPESLAKAEEFLMAYPETMTPWKMDVESYLKTRVEEKASFTEKELGQLRMYQLDIFSFLKDEMRDQKCSTDPERLLGEMISELKYHYQT